MSSDQWFGKAHSSHRVSQATEDQEPAVLREVPSWEGPDGPDPTAACTGHVGGHKDLFIH